MLYSREQSASICGVGPASRSLFTFSQFGNHVQVRACYELITSAIDMRGTKKNWSLLPAFLVLLWCDLVAVASLLVSDLFTFVVIISNKFSHRLLRCDTTVCTRLSYLSFLDLPDSIVYMFMFMFIFIFGCGKFSSTNQNNWMLWFVFVRT
ncbi:hypothetical protein BGW36DRAFT_137249 [Talaromyces proteolyticus]|uniref:Uncharacterized protein n=1 Tax=Talaromyces proteolyticus TaxID=1131652 RepID=A0AAD4PY72_9EURO|nr:uncharacterized protein BGW36DRAFT_137249 [Talaromyces proteolyticus]KAH8700850.1 hypothetical protein BGW36DRAFT_137249 [Talaromyces proteolyticus]